MTEITHLIRPDMKLEGERRGWGPHVLLLHAGGENRKVWRPIMGQLEERGFLSVAFDQRGHGDSDKEPAGSIVLFGDDTRAMLAGLITPVLVGASLGGFAALLALADVEAQAGAAGLVLVDVVPEPDSAQTRAYLGAEGRQHLGRLPLVADILDHPEPLRQAAAALQLPVLLVCAGAGSPLSNTGVQRFLAVVPHAQVRTIAGASHLVARDAPAELATILACFLDSDSVRMRRIAHFLAVSGAHDLSHPGGTLAEHLRRTGERLRAWGYPSWVIDAGYVHAAFGTEGFPVPLVDAEACCGIEAVVGARAAELVRLYGRCDRRRSYPSWGSDAPCVFDRITGDVVRLGPSDREYLIALTVANELDVVAHDEKLLAQHGVRLLALFTSWRSWLPEEALRALDEDWCAGGSSVERAAKPG